MLHDLLLLPVARPWLVAVLLVAAGLLWWACLLYTSPSPRD